MLAPDVVAQKNNDKLTLIFIRHAKSSHDIPDLHDFDRPLNKRGYSDAPEMGKRLAARNIDIDLVVASPSVRTCQTISPIITAIGYPLRDIEFNPNIYRVSKNKVLEEIKQFDNSKKTIVVVGHNPATTELANMLQSTEEIANVPTCGIVCIEFKAKSWSKIKKGKLVFFDYPKKGKK